MKKTKTKKEMKAEKEELMKMKQDNLSKISAEMINPARMSHGEMKRLLEGVKAFKVKIKELDNKINNAKN